MKEREFARVINGSYGHHVVCGEFLGELGLKHSVAKQQAREINAAHRSAVREEVKRFAEEAAQTSESRCSYRRLCCMRKMKCKVCSFAMEIRKLAEEFK
jgi:hypothetical protein